MPVYYPRCRAQLTLLLENPGGGTQPTKTIEVQPRSASVARNGYHEADTWNLEFDTRLLPVDPDQIRQIEVRIFMWDSQGGDLVVNLTPDKERIRGLADDHEGVIAGEDNTIKLSGRDYTGVLLDVEWDARNKVPSGLPLNAAIQHVADQAAPPGTIARFQVVVDTPRDMPIIGGPIGKKRSTKAKGEWVKPGKNHWDIIYDMAISSGFVVFVSMFALPGEEPRPSIVIQDPKTQTKETLQKAPRLAYGKHLKRLEVKRKFGREKVPQQVLVTYDPLKKQEITVTYPEARNVVVTVFDTRIAVKKDEQEFVPAPKDIYDRDTLLEYAKLRFFYRGRAETAYTLETDHLALTQEGQTFQLLDLQPGSPVGVAFDPFNREHIRSLSVGERIEHLREQGYKADVASLIANNLQVLSEFEQPYYFSKGEFDYDIEDGIRIKLEAVNFTHALRQEQLAAESDQSAGLRG